MTNTLPLTISFILSAGLTIIGLAAGTPCLAVIGLVGIGATTYLLLTRQ
jgi:hypothetical protein